MYNGCSTDGNIHTRGLSPSSSDSEQSCFYFDKLNRKHYITPHTCPAIVCVRASKFYSSTSHTHTVDLMHIFNAVVMEKRTAVTLGLTGVQPLY